MKTETRDSRKVSHSIIYDNNEKCQILVRINRSGGSHVCRDLGTQGPGYSPPSEYRISAVFV